MYDVAIIGAGPVGLATAIAAQRAGLSAVVLDKGALVNSIVGYPARMEFFSTPDLIEIGDHPFPVQGYKPTREEGLEYYRTVTAREGIDLRLYEPVERVDGVCGAFTVVTTKTHYASRYVVVATGFYDHPNMLGVPGEDLPHVSHYYREPYPYVGQRVAIIGARNSAAKAALDCYRHGAHVTMIVRGAAISEKVKYWIKPDLDNRIREGSITAHFSSTVTAIAPGTVSLATPQGPHTCGADWVLALTGYRPDYTRLAAFGITIGDDEARTPLYDDTTYESRRPGVYLAGTVCGGLHTGRWFIENGRFHARQIVAHITGTTPVDAPPAERRWKTEE
jgi:thioredoxin reductase (NADPH)